jgi:parallel beta-helix repeat protein
MLSDGGGIYTLGTQNDTIIRNNVFHDVFPYMGKPAMAWGIYMDQRTNGLLIENNIVYNTLTGGIMNTGMRRNIVRNNIFAFSARQAVWRWQFQGEPPTTFERNIIYLTQGDLFHMDGGQDDVRSKWDHNLFWRTDGEELMFYEHTFDEWQAKGMDRHSMVADPQFVDPAGYDFRLRPTSPALGLGFKPIDATGNGLYGPPEWVNLPKRAEFPPTVLPPLPPPPPPVPIDDNFENTPVCAPPKLATLYVEGKGDSICVTDETAASGNRSLKVADTSGLEHPWNPHMVYVQHFRKGKAALSFDVRIEKGAIFDHEWRDVGHPYRVGPSIRINREGTLLANGKPLAVVPLGKWFHIDIACGLGKKASPNYKLTVRLLDEDLGTFDEVPFQSEKFKQIEWLGFVSNATEKAVFYLDNLKLELVE